jgi:hypothetical protein
MFNRFQSAYADAFPGARISADPAAAGYFNATFRVARAVRASSTPSFNIANHRYLDLSIVSIDRFD